MRIVDVAGGFVTTLAGEETRRLPATDIIRVRARRNDSVLNGAIIGAGTAIGPALYFCSLVESWDVCSHEIGPMIKIGALGAGIGMGIDALIRGRKTIYETAPRSTGLHLAPILRPDRKGLEVSLSF
jgi:hypothetical protein